MKIPARLRYPALSLLAFVSVVSGWVFVQSMRIEATVDGRLFDQVAALPHRHVGVLLGCSARLSDGRTNLFFTRRVAAAVELFKAKKVDYLLVSGDNGAADYDEPTMLKKALLKAGVPADRIVLDYAGFRTLDSMVRAREVFGQSSFTVVSQRFHNARAVYIALGRGIDAIGFNAGDVGGQAGFKVHLREAIARMGAVVDVRLLGTEPRYLGPRVAIGG